MEQKEPSMEEILSSIRRILSHEEEAVTSSFGKDSVSQMDADETKGVMELTEQMAVSEEPLVKSDTFIPDDMVLLSEAAVQASSEHLNDLLQKNEPKPLEETEKKAVSMNGSLEEIVMMLLRPYLKEWLDKNLPSMVEKIVQREVSRLTEKVRLS